MSDHKKTASGKTKWLAWVRRIVLILLVIEVGWLLVANIFLNTPLGPWAINRKPEKISVTWARAFTPYPARVHITDLSFKQKTRTMGLVISAEKVSARVGLLPFFVRTLRAVNLEAEGVSVQVDRSGGSGLPPSPKTEPGFMVELLDITIDRLKEFRLDDVVMTGGETTVTGNFEIQVRSHLEVRDADLRWTGARIRLGDQPISEQLDLGFRGGFTPFNPKAEKGMAMLAHLKAWIEINGQVNSLRPLGIFFAGTKWIERIDGAGDVALSLGIEEGRFMPGTIIDVEADNLLLDFMGFRATGTGGVDGLVAEDGGRHEGFVSVVFDEFTFGRSTDEQPLAQGNELRLTTRGEGLGRVEMISGMNVTLDLPGAAVPDITLLGQYLPAGLGVSLTGGEASLAVHLEARVGEEEAEGTFKLTGERLSGRYHEFDFQTDLDLDTRVSGSNWNDFEVKLEGTEFRLFNGLFHHPKVDVREGWWMTVKVPRGRANLAVPFNAEADVDLTMRDTRVIVALFSEVKTWVSRIDGLLTVEDVVGHTRASVTDQHLSVRDLSLEGDKLEARGELEIARTEKNGLFWVRYGVLKLALERIGDQKKWKMVNAREWFDEQRAARWVSGSGEALVPVPEVD